MLTSSEEFSSFFGSEHVPPLNERTISFVELFLTFSLDSDFQIYSSTLQSFFSQHFNQLFSIRQENLDENEDKLYSRLILSLSYLRPLYIPKDFFASAENCAYYCLTNFTGQIRQASFSFLCTHYCNQRKNPGEGLFSFIKWIHQYFSSCAQNVNDIDIKFFIIVTSSMKPLLSRVIDYPQINNIQARSTAQQPQNPQNPQNPQKNAPTQQQIQQQQLRQQQLKIIAEKIPDFLTPITEIVKQGLLSCTSQIFSMHNELIINKSLRLIIKFFEISIKPTQTVFETLREIRRLIPDDSRYFHIHENFLIVSFCISEIDKDTSSNSFGHYAVSQALLLLPFSTQYPLSSNKRIQFYLRSLKSFFGKIQKKTIENFKVVMEAIWPLFGCPKIHVFSHRTVCEVLYKMISKDLLKSNPKLTTSILRELISCFDLLRIDFETSQQDLEFELGNWIEVNDHLIKLSFTFISMEAESQDEKERLYMIHPSLRMPLYRQMTKHMIFVLDVIILTPEIKEKVIQLLDSFALLIATLTMNSPNYFQENMLYLLPKAPQQNLHFTLHQYLIKKLTKPIYYYCCFFDTINTHFDKLFLPSPTLQLLETTRLVFNKAFTEEGGMQQPRYYNKMCIDLFRFFLKGCLSRDYYTMKLLSYIIQITSRNLMNPKLQVFLQNFKQIPYSIPNIIRYMCEDPRIKAQASSMAIFLYLFCDPFKGCSASDEEKIKTASEWYALFIPAIESELHPSYSILPFYSSTASKFSEQIPNFPKPLQYRLITSLALSFSKLKNTDINTTDINSTLTLLSRIPSITAELSRSTSIVKVQHMYVTIDGIEVDLDIVKNMLKKTAPQTITSNADFLCDIFQAITDQIDFQSATGSDAVDTIAEIVCRDRIDFLKKITAILIDKLYKINAILAELNIESNNQMEIPNPNLQQSENNQQVLQPNENHSISIQNSIPNISPSQSQGSMLNISPSQSQGTIPNLSPNMNQSPMPNMSPSPSQASLQNRPTYSFNWKTNQIKLENLGIKYKILKGLQIIFYFRVKHMSISGNNHGKQNSNPNSTQKTNSNPQDNNNLHDNNTENDKEIIETEEEKVKRYEEEILRIFLDLNDESSKAIFFEGFFVLIYSKATSIFALKAIEIMAKNFDFTQVVHKLIAVVLHGAQYDYTTSKRIMNESIFPLLRRCLSPQMAEMNSNENINVIAANPIEISQDKKIEIYRQYYQSCSHSSHNVSKLSISGMRFIESLKLMPQEIPENRKKYITKLQSIIAHNQSFQVNFIFYKPFDDIPENPQLINDLLTILEKQVQSVYKEVINIVNTSPSRDRNLINYFNAKFALKASAYYLASIPPSATTQTTWEKLLIILRETANRHFYGYFLRQLTKRKPNPSMPYDCSIIISKIYTQISKLLPQSQAAAQSGASAGSSGQNTPNANLINALNIPFANDLELLKLMIMNNGPKLNKQMAEQLMSVILKHITQNPSLLQQSELIGAKILEILKVATHQDFSKIIPFIFEATVTLNIKTNPAHLPIGMISEKYSHQLAAVFVNSLFNKWNNTIFYLFAKLVSDYNNVLFRKIVIDRLKMTTDSVKEYVIKHQNLNEFDIDFAINVFLTSAEKITNNPNCTLEMFRDVIEIVQKLSDLLPQDKNKFTIYKPSVFNPMIGLCFPNLSQISEQGFTDDSNEDRQSHQTNPGIGSIFQQMVQKRRQINLHMKKPIIKTVNQNIRDVSIMTDLLIPFFLRQPKLFLNRIFVKRFTEFVRLTFTTFEERDIIYKKIELMAREPDQIYSQLLCWQLLSTRLKYFPEDSKILYSSENPLHIGFKDFPVSPLVPSYLLHFTATMIAARSNKKDDEQGENNENDYVFIDDLTDNRTLLVESSMASIALYRNIYTLDQSCHTISRFFHIIRFLQHTKFPFDMPTCLTRLFNILSMTPNCSKPANTAFRAFASLDVGKDPRVCIFSTLFSWANLYSVGQTPEKNFLYIMPVILKKLQEPPYARERVFEQLAYCTLMLFEKLNESFHQIGPHLPSAYEEIIPNLSVGKVHESCKTTIDRIKKKMSEVPCQELSPLLRCLPSLFASMSRVLLHNDHTFCPPPLLPNVLLEMASSPAYKEFRATYQRAMISCISVSGSKYSQFLINELHKVLKKNSDHVTNPLKTPFATVCLWINEFTNDHKFFFFVSTYLEIFKPQDETQIVQELLNMKQPIHFTVEDYILKNIPLTDNLKRFVLFCPSIRPVYIQNAAQLKIEEARAQNIEINEDDQFRLDSLYDICWNTQWQEVAEPVHPYYFAKLILPKCMTPFVKFFTIKQITELINIALASINEDKKMNKFAEYYSALYPTSTLSECFATVYNLFGNKTPLPLQTPYQAMKYLESRNFYDDSLGILKVNYPEYLTAATFHQLSNYATAKAHYINTMDQHEESYFFGLMFLRACEINLSLSRASIPFEMISGNEISLPFLQSYSCPNVFTSFFSPVFMPLILRFSIIEGLHTATKFLQQIQANFNQAELIKQTSSIVLKCLDKQTANASNFAWKLSLLQYCQTLNEQSIQPTIQDVIKKNRNYIACLLMKTGDTKGALKMLDMSLGHQILPSNNASSSTLSLPLPSDGMSPQQQQQQSSLLQLRNQASLNLNIVMSTAAAASVGNNGAANINSNSTMNYGPDSLMKTFKITTDNFPRILRFVSKRQLLSLPRLLQFRILKELRYPVILDSLINAGTGANTQGNSTVTNPGTPNNNTFNSAVAALTQQQSHASLASSLAGHHHGHHGPSPSQISAASSGGQNFAQILVAAAAAKANANSSANAANASSNSSQSQSVAAVLSRAINSSNNSNNNNNSNNTSSLSNINNTYNQLNNNIAYVLNNSNKIWVDTLVSILSTDSISIDQNQVFMRIQKELLNVKEKSERANFLIALSLGLVRLEELYKPAFINTMLTKNLPDEIKGHWIKWLQLLISYVKDPPHEFLADLYRFHPIWFIMVARTPKPTQHFIEFFKAIEKNTNERRQRFEFDLAFNCLRKFDVEMKSYIKTFQLRNFLFHHMASPKETTIPQEISDQFEGNLENMAKYCDTHPVVFTTKQKIPDYHTINGFKFPTVNQPIAAISFNADGKNEAYFKLTTVTGESRRFSAVSPYIYKFQLRESLLMFGLSKIFDKHPSLRTRSSFNFYPQSFPVYNFILIAHYPLVSLQKIGHDNHIEMRLYNSYINRTEPQNDGPFSNRERKQTDLPEDTFQKAYVKFAKGSLIDFLFARQSFASHLALSCVLRYLFNFPILPVIPMMMISGDGQRVVIPDFFSQRTSFSQIPITRNIRASLPDFIMHGSFSTTWIDVLDALQRNHDTFRIYLKVLYPDEQKAIPKIDQSLRKLERMSSHSQEETNVFGPPFPVLIINNLIDCAVNTFEAQLTGFSWI